MSLANPSEQPIDRDESTRSNLAAGPSHPHPLLNEKMSLSKGPPAEETIIYVGSYVPTQPAQPEFHDRPNPMPDEAVTPDPLAIKAWRRRFAESLRWLRRYAGLSRRTLAQRAGVPRATIAALERGTESPSDTTRASLEQAIGCPLYFGPHQKVTMRHKHGEQSIDVGIAPLMREPSLAGIYTTLSSQQETRGRVWIEFQTSYDLIQFLKIVACYRGGRDGLYWRITEGGRDGDTLPAWEYSTIVMDVALQETIIDDSVEYLYTSPADFGVFVSVRFPPQDLPVVLQRLKEHNAKADDSE